VQPVSMSDSHTMRLTYILKERDIVKIVMFIRRDTSVYPSFKSVHN